MTEYYTRALLQTNLYKTESLNGRYKNRVMSVSVWELQTYFLQISDDVKDSEARQHYTQLVSAWFSALRLLIFVGSGSVIELCQYNST